MNLTSYSLYGLYLAFALGAVGLYLCLPSARVRAYRLDRIGGIIGAAGLAGVAVYCTCWLGAGLVGREFFIVFAIIAVAAAVRVVSHQRAVYSALYFGLVVLAVTGMSVLAAAEFLAAALVIVYGGAILVTYVFVIMLSQQAGEAPYDARSREPFAAVAMGFALVAGATQAMVATGPMVRHEDQRHRPAAEVAWQPESSVVMAGSESIAAAERIDPAAVNSSAGNTRAVGRELVRKHMMAVQVGGVLMLVGMAGAIVIARKQIAPEDLTPEERIVPGEDPRRRGREAAPF